MDCQLPIANCRLGSGVIARRAASSGLPVSTRRRSRMAGVESTDASTCASQRVVGESDISAKTPRSQAVFAMM